MSTAGATETNVRYAPDDLLNMPDGKDYELVGGRLVERHTGAESSEIGGNLFLRLGLFCQQHDLGKLWPADNGYQYFPHDPKQVRKPDVSFIRKGRLPGNASPKGWIRIVPDLVVEVVSPGDLAEDLEEKLEDYQKVAVPLVWVIYPSQRMARVFRSDGPPAVVREDDELSGEDILPGFRCRLGDILPRQAPTAEPPTAPNGPAPESH
ncbi:MAG: Uma2 family endonuclease [Isosphaeraceae bacterium]